MKLIVKIISTILGFIWRLFWRIVMTVFFSILFFIGILYITNPSKGDFLQSLQQDANHVYRYISGQDSNLNLGQDVKNVAENLTDDHSSHVEGARWNEASATIYIDTQDQSFRQAYLEAIQAWNETGVFTFKLIDNKEEANIIATEMDDANVSAAGEAESQTNIMTSRFTHVTVRLNRYYLLNSRYGYTHERIVNTAEHELGHAIGLDHNEEESVMQSAGSFYSIQEQDIQAVAELYSH